MTETLLAVDPPERMSQTLAGYLDSCPRAAYLSLAHGTAPGLELDRGSAAHAFQEIMYGELAVRGEQSLYAPQPGEDAMLAAREVSTLTKGMVDTILADRPDLVVSAAEAEHVRKMAYHLAVGSDVDPATIVGLERKFVLDLDCGWVLSGKVDIIAMPDATTFAIDDMKTSLHVPTEGEFEDSFQHKAYGLLAVFGQPVEKQPCAEPEACALCMERGGHEVRLDPIGEHVRQVLSREIFPRARPKELEGGRLRLTQRGPVKMTRLDLLDFKVDVERAALRLERGLAEGDWPARRGSHCSRCPAKSQCPIPRQVRGEGTIETIAEAAAALEQAEGMSKEGTRLREQAKAFAAAQNTAIPAGRDEVFDFDTSHERSVKKAGKSADWDGLELAIDNAIVNGEVFDIREWVPEKPVTRFKRRKALAAEVAALLTEEVDDDGRGDDGNGAARRRELDERFGDAAPF